jgi:beta-1,4-mannosyl-glycoprotein beta-1,4-N-acetylglucosaminyltransferase
MYKSKILDCITFFDNNFMFNLRYNILKNYVDYFVVCESKFNHKGIEKKKFYLERQF